MATRRRRALKVVLALLGALAVLLLGLWLFLTSDAGGALLRDRILQAANGALQGKVEANGLSLAGGKVVLLGVKLYTPEGELVAEIDRVDAEVALAPLLDGRVEVTSARIERPRFFLVHDERGLNLARAVAPRVPAVSGGAPAVFHIDLRKVALHQGEVSFVSGEQRYAAEGVDANVAALIAGPPLQLDGSVGITGRLTAPLAAPLEIHVDSAKGQATAAVVVGDSRAAGVFAFAGREFQLTSARLAPALVRALAPAVKLRVPVTVSGKVSPQAAVLDAQAGRATLHAEATLGGGPALLPSVEAKLEHLDLSELFEGARRSELEAKLLGNLDDARPASLTGRLMGAVRWRGEKGEPLAEAAIDVRAEDGTLRANPVKVEVPGAYFTLRGTGSMKALGLSGRLVAEDLRSSARALGELTGQSPPQLGGQGVLSLSVSGPLLHPALTAKGTFVDLELPGVAFEGLDLDASLPDVTRPLEAHGTLTAASVRFGEQSLEHLQATVASTGRQLEAKVSTAGLAGLALELQGTLSPRLDALDLKTLALTTPAAVWTLESPVPVSWAGDVAVGPLALRSDGQRLGVTFGRTRKGLQVALDAQAVDLARLPELAVPRKAGLGGTVDAHVALSGRWPKLAGDVKARWSEGRLARFQGLAAVLDAHSDGASLTGALELSAPFASAKGSVSAPLEALSPRSEVPVQASLVLERLELQGLSAALAQPLPLDGTVRASVEVGGPLSALHPKLRVESNALTVHLPPGEETPARTLALSDVDAAIETDAEAKLGGHLALTALGGRLALDLQSHLTLPEVLAHPPRGAAAWQALELELGLHLSKLQLAALAPAGLGPELAGVASAELSAQGTLKAPRFESSVTVQGLGAPRLLPVDLQASLRSTRNDTSLSIDIQRQAKALAGLKGRVSAPVEALLDLSRATDTPLVLEATVGPLGLAEVFPASQGEGPPPSGTLSASLSLEGSLASPKAKLRAALEKLSVGKLPLGGVALSWDYQQGQHQGAAVLTSSGGGKLKAVGKLELDSSLPAARKGLAWEKAPFELSLTSEKFDLGFLSGAHPMVRTLGGFLTAQAKASGPLGSPDVSGTVEWKQGRLGLAGFGEYRDISVALAVSPEKLTVSTLEAKAGGGTLNFHGEANRTGRGVYALQLAGATRSLPIITDDQLVALATLRTEVTGQLDPSLLGLKVSLPEAHVELPDVARKDLQELKAHPDVVLVRQGVPLKRKARAAGAPRPAPTRLVRVQIDAPRNLWLKSTDVNLELGLSEAFQVEVADEVRVSGEAFVRRGRIDVIGRKFDVENTSSVRFQGDPRLPYLNITAVHLNEREGVTVFVTVVGRGKDFSLKTSSQPPLSESEIYTLLATGRRTLKRGSGAAITPEQAASVVGSLAASQFKKVIAQRLPLDVLSIETGAEGLQRARVEAGTYLTDQLYLGYSLQVGADPRRGENTHAGRLEYQISRQWSFEAFAGDARAIGADLVWTREY